ncbi:malonate decarboxylase holo-ACP synthase [Oceanobacter kriegii]|uniref:malonate decarboxylase holo-ACP synthase n=1 Tax=Oceanobacter kriegii TaxID=64972 RepID=UPI0004142050|nr:malonate decarboxylase holo-ACP synthase [Oceanobacter kriegii]
MNVHPHDLLRFDVSGLRAISAQQPLPVWLSFDRPCQQGSAAKKTAVQTGWTVVRRALHRECEHTGARLIPVGLRGANKQQRYAAWLEAGAVLESRSPEQLAIPAQQRMATGDHPVWQALQGLATSLNNLSHQNNSHQNNSVSWGVTGSLGFELATGIEQLTDSSDLDLLIRAPLPLSPAQLQSLHTLCWQQACRVDIQIETPVGAFALKEWLSDSHTLLLKTATGPVLTSNPWQQVQPQKQAQKQVQPQITGTKTNTTTNTTTRGAIA